MPAVIGQRAQERLVDGAADEPLRPRVVVQHELQGVRLGLDPEFVQQLDIPGDGEGRGFAGVDDDGVVVRLGDGAHALTEFTHEEVIP